MGESHYKKINKDFKCELIIVRISQDSKDSQTDEYRKRKTWTWIIRRTLPDLKKSMFQVHEASIEKLKKWKKRLQKKKNV